MPIADALRESHVRNQSPAALTILDFASVTRARLRVFNDVSHYEGVPPRVLQRRLSRWWGLPGR